MKGSRQEQLNRVKVYFLSDVWIDNGTGYCFGEIRDGEAPCLVVRNELDQDEELLKATIEGAIQFQRQQETLIVWTTSDGQSIALSFQEKDGCSTMCDFIIHVFSTKLAPLISLVSVVSSDADGEITELVIGPVNLPQADPKVDDLMNILNCFNENPNSAYQKQCISSFIQTHDFIPKLVTLFHECELKKQIKNLHLLCNIIKTLIVYNESLTTEIILDDKNMMGVIGILEYDPDFPAFKASHRKYLEDESNFKEILPVNDDHIKNLIKKTFKLQFLKDVVLARLLDDPSFNVISTLIHFNQVEVIKFLETSDFIDTLLKIYDDEKLGPESKRDGIKLLHQFVLIAKNLPAKQRTKFYKSLIKKGLFKTIDFVLQDDSLGVRVQGTELIVSIIEHDALLINGIAEDGDTNDEQSKDDWKDELEDSFNGEQYERDDILRGGRIITLSDDMTLLHILTKFLLEDNEPGLRIQAYEALKSLLDPTNTSSPCFLADEETTKNLNTTAYFKAFYEEVSPKLFAPLIRACDQDIDTRGKEDMFMYLFDLVNFCSNDKRVSRSFFMENHILKGIAHLIKPQRKLQLRLAAIRSIKYIVLLNDDYYMRYIISNDLFHEIFNLFQELKGVPDMTYSTILDLLEIILMGIEKGDNRKNFKLLANYVVKTYRSVLEGIKDVESGKDLIKFVDKIDEEEKKQEEENDYDDMVTRQEIMTEPLEEEDSIIQDDVFKENICNGITIEKRLRDEEPEHVNKFESVTKKKSTLKERFTSAGKKIASKFGQSK
jgi:protein phosphatase-4 regulatory subunit 3